jgi:hypothetical protein
MQPIKSVEVKTERRSLTNGDKGEAENQDFYTLHLYLNYKLCLTKNFLLDIMLI